MAVDIRYQRYRGAASGAVDLLLPLCAEIFPDFDAAYLSSRVPHIADPDLWLAYEGQRLVGFKLGYRRGPNLLYSWLGGVLPAARRSGVAAGLMQRQHEHAAADGYRFIETRTRAANNPMIVLNLRSGFQIVGFEIDARGMPIVTQRKSL